MPPRSFLVFATALIGALHLYIGMRLLPGLPVPAFWKLIGAAWLLASSVLVPLGLLSRGIQQQPLADRLAWIGLLAMGLFSSLLVLSVLRDVVLLLIAAGAALGLFSYPPHLAAELASSSAIAVMLLALFSTVAGFLNARRLARVINVEVPIAKLPDALQGFKIAQISDIHVGPTIKRAYLERIVARVNALEADMVAVTGDLVDGSVAALSSHTAPLATLRARHGSFFVTGNHEYYANADEWIEEMRRLGLRVLLNEHVVLTHAAAPLVVAGVTDFNGGHFGAAHRSDPQAAMKGAPQDSVKILLAHQPRSATAAEQVGFDLQLSGHTHGGQFWPWNLFVPLQQPYTAGLHRLRAMWIYVSRGTGYWGPPKRFGAPSEITLLRLVSA
ncbi:metallophosphoesterase [Uliginosibacterium sp. H3]|uniref:Metallophosphoesterase n=1 Tax=Uliginosibacterium silvisoli TaxID=3114758 RepID=A0ABU6K601_9RHOO|nr:metallophosphoesterase [Uliginosibacterium sp. H3]